MSPSSSANEQFPDVTLDESERSRLSIFFRGHVDRILEHNRLAALVQKREARTKERDENIDRIKAAGDRAFEEAQERAERKPEIPLLRGRRRR